jgi:two-component system, response regulator / RNA-binding antiterminator
MKTDLRIVIVISEPIEYDQGEEAMLRQERSRLLRIALLDQGYDLLATLPADPFLKERLEQLRADLVIVDAESDARDALEHVVIATRDHRRPIVMFTNDADTEHVNQAVASGVTAYIVDGLAPERIKPILTVAMARFRHQEALLDELDKTKAELAHRSLIEQAKSILMQRQGWSEQEAYTRLRSMAMNKGLKLSEISQQVIEYAQFLG